MNQRKNILIILILFSQLLFAEEKEPTIFIDAGRKSLIATIDTVGIDVHDGVTGGCLPNPSKLKDKLEIKLRKNGFKIEEDYKNAYNKIFVELIGYKVANSSCAVHIDAKMYSFSMVTVPHAPVNDNLTIMNIPFNIGSVLLTGDRYSMQSRLEKEIEEFGDKLYLDISRAKDDTFRKFPSIKKIYESKKLSSTR